MKKLLLAGLSALSLAAPASAADLAARPYTKAAPIIATVYDWSGFYVGANGGWGSSHKCWDLSTGAGAFLAADGCHDATGGVAGGQIGYRWQAGTWVFGLEGQGDWADLRGSNISLFLGPPAITNRSRIDSFGLLTGQVGYAINNVLWYVKGGAAVTHDKYDGSFTAGGILIDEGRETRWGGVVGTGLEFGFAPNWSVAVEYDHMFMGKNNVDFTSLLPPPPVGFLTRNETISHDVDLVTVRVNYRFGGGPVIAKY